MPGLAGMITGLALLAFGIPGEIPALGRDLLRAGDFTGGPRSPWMPWQMTLSRCPRPPAVFHRVGAIACGGLNTMPHDGAVVTYLSYCKISHRRGCLDMFMAAGPILILAKIAATILGTTIGIVCHFGRDQQNGLRRKSP